MKMENLFDLAICAFLSTLGGLAQLLSAKSKRAVKLSEMCTKAFVSLSIGVGIYLAVNAAVPAATSNIFVVYAAGYFAGWGGPWIINGIIDKVAKDKNIEKPEKK